MRQSEMNSWPIFSSTVISLTYSAARSALGTRQSLTLDTVPEPSISCPDYRYGRDYRYDRGYRGYETRYDYGDYR